MGKRWTRWFAVLAGVIALPLAVSVVLAQDAKSPGAGTGVAQGRAIYDAQRCLRCHAIAGEGNTRNPLDGIGTRRTAGEIRLWITGDDAIKANLSPRVLSAKQRHTKLTAAQLDALVAYLSTLRK